MSGTLRIISNKPDPSEFDADISVRANELTGRWDRIRRRRHDQRAAR